MPSIRDISVHIIDSHGIQLDEWGVQHLRTQESQDKVSAYVKSESDMAFSIVIEAKIPYTDYNPDVTISEDPERLSHLPHRRRVDHWDGSASYTYQNPRGSEPGRRRKYQSSPVRSPSITPSAPPFDLLATLYLDGREKAERRTIIYLDPAYEDFSCGPAGQGARAIMKNRWVAGKDGNIYEHAWVFKAIGIETILDKMALTTNNSSANEDEDLLIDALSRSGICHEDDLKREESKKAGRIEVRIMRVVIGRKTIDNGYRPKHRENEKDDIDMKSIESELTHTTAFTPKGTIDSARIPVISYEPYKGVHEPFAIFSFFYRSQEILEKYNFPGFRMRENKVFRKRNYVDSSINNMTPLGIANGHISSSQSKRYEGEASFEERIQKGIFKKEQTPKYNFDDQNRRLTPVKAEESSQSDNNRPLNGNHHRRLGSRVIKVEPGDDKNIIHALPDYRSTIAADKSGTPLISAAEDDGKLLLEKSDKTLSLSSRSQSNGFAIHKSAMFDPNDSCYGSADTVSPRSHNERASPDTNGSFSPDVSSKAKAGKPLKSHTLSPFVSSQTVRHEASSSDADDEQEPTSDNESCASESDMEFDDDDGTNLDKDDGGLHEQVREQMKLGKRTRERDEESYEGEVEETIQYDIEKDQPRKEDVENEEKTPNSDWKQTTSKRVKVMFETGS